MAAHFCPCNPCPICHPLAYTNRASLTQEVVQTYEQAVPQRVPAGVAVVIERYGCVLMGKRKSSQGAGTWSFPGGWIEPSDLDLISAAIREVREETGLVVSELSVVDAVLTHYDDGRHAVTVLFRAGVAEGQPNALEPEKLEGRWTWVDPRDLPQPLFTPLLNSSYVTRIRDGFRL
jgi:8-oxo-dGTP diphosphatase